jgi:hypothetical protein
VDPGTDPYKNGMGSCSGMWEALNHPLLLHLVSSLSHVIGHFPWMVSLVFYGWFMASLLSILWKFIINSNLLKKGVFFGTKLPQALVILQKYVFDPLQSGPS